MADKDFREDKITITREEVADVIAVITAKRYRNALKLAEENETEVDYEQLNDIGNLLIDFGAELLTSLFDETNIGEEIEIEDT